MQFFTMTSSMARIRSLFCSSGSLSSLTRSFSAMSPADVQLWSADFSLRRGLQKDEEVRCALSYCLSFSSDESDFLRNFAHLDSIMKRQLAYSSCYQRTKYVASPQKERVDFAPLPRTLADALRPAKSRAVVITEAVAPFRVVDVNACWENLCGYTFGESKGKTLGSLLRGPETNAVSATGLIAKLLQGEDEAGTTLINYTKQGRRFRNRIRVGPLKDERGYVTHFVGILQEIRDVTM